VKGNQALLVLLTRWRWKESEDSSPVELPAPRRGRAKAVLTQARLVCRGVIWIILLSHLYRALSSWRQGKRGVLVQGSA